MADDLVIEVQENTVEILQNNKKVLHSQLQPDNYMQALQFLLSRTAFNC
jgi:hypothetical protein